jgi:hypothetical protein
MADNWWDKDFLEGTIFGEAQMPEDDYGIGSFFEDDDWVSDLNFDDLFAGDPLDFSKSYTTPTDPYGFDWLGDVDIDEYLTNLTKFTPPNPSPTLEEQIGSYLNQENLFSSDDPVYSIPSGIFDMPDIGDAEDLTFLQRMGVGEDHDTPQWLKVIGDLLGVGGSKDGKRQGILGLPQQLLGGGQDGGEMGTLGKLLLANYLTKKDEGPAGIVPIGAEAYGGEGGSPIDYRVFNLQPALMPGVAYANVGTQSPPPTTPPGMKGGGLGDITLAKLEPGEFVVTKKAVDNVGAQNLYKMMKQWEGRG